jgi:ABC-type Fe3+ transport system permease subunit
MRVPKGSSIERGEKTQGRGGIVRRKKKRKFERQKKHKVLLGALFVFLLVWCEGVCFFFCLLLFLVRREKTTRYQKEAHPPPKKTNQNRIKKPSYLIGVVPFFF